MTELQSAYCKTFDRTRELLACVAGESDSTYSVARLQTNRSTLRTSTEGLISSVEDGLNNVRSEGDFSPRSSCPTYVR
jgi:hypothetical protein